jgi:hypothetical protein
MDGLGPAEGRREAGAEPDALPLGRRPLMPKDGEVVAQEGLVSFWCARCARWVDAHIDVEGAKAVHERISHPH